jgi:hypothetical protein
LASSASARAFGRAQAGEAERGGCAAVHVARRALEAVSRLLEQRLGLRHPPARQLGVAELET